MYTQLLSLRSPESPWLHLIIPKAKPQRHRTVLCLPFPTVAMREESHQGVCFINFFVCFIKIYPRIPGLGVFPTLLKDLCSTPLDGVALSTRPRRYKDPPSKPTVLPPHKRWCERSHQLFPESERWGFLTLGRLCKGLEI